MQRIHFNEVVTRDGFQNEPAFVPTDAKVALIDALSACGYAKIEVTSFTSARACCASPRPSFTSARTQYPRG